MAMVVMGGMCVQSITAIHTTISNLWAAMLLYSLRLFAVGGEDIAMVVEDMSICDRARINQPYAAKIRNSVLYVIVKLMIYCVFS